MATRDTESTSQAGAELNASASMEASRAVVKKARFTSEVLESLQESLSRAADKNDSLLEAVEATEARASREGQEEGEVIMIASLTNHFKSGRVEIESSIKLFSDILLFMCYTADVITKKFACPASCLSHTQF